MEHWAASRGSKKQKDGSHIHKHQELQRKGAEPDIVLRFVSSHRTALSRQTAEAVRIMKRGGAGAVLNSKSEFNRCLIPRLQLLEEDTIKELEQAEEKELKDTTEELQEFEDEWEQRKREHCTGSRRSSNQRSS